MSIAPSGLAGLTPGEKRELLARLVREKSEKPRSYPMSFSQQRLWFLDQLAPGNTSYNVEAAQPIRGLVNVKALERSINEIVRRHDVLRTTFREIDGQPMQVVAPSVDLELPIFDLSSHPPEEREREKERLLLENARTPFDLARGPLFRVSLLKLGYYEHLFLLRMHHIIADGWSMGIFARELSTLYTAYASGRHVELDELPIQYADFAVWQRQWLTGKVLEEQLAYWKKQLTDLPVLELPTDRPRPPVQTFRGSHHDFVLPQSLAEALEELSRRQGVTLFMTLLAGFKLLLQRYSRQEEVVIGTYIANRNRAEIEGLIGFFLNTLVLRTRVAEAASFRELIERVREVALGAYAHQDLPFEMLVEELQPPRDLSRNPLFQVTFQLNNVPTQAAMDDPAAVLEARRGASIFDVALLFVQTRRGVAGQIEYSTDLFDAATIERLADQLVVLFEGVVRDVGQAPAALPLLRPAERRQVVESGNGPARERPWETGLVELFAARVRERPEAQAFRFKNQSITYRELDRRSSRMARHLRASHVGRERVVGLCMERSPELVVALLGVVKAGGAWLPLDPAWPRERLAPMLRDSEARAVVTTDAFAGRLPGGDFAVVRVDGDREAIARRRAGHVGNPPGPDDLAFVIFTSGSTGRPKGVAATHRQILNRLWWMWDAYPFAEREVGCQKTSFSFIDSIWELFGPLLSGIGTVILPDPVVRDPERLVVSLAEHEVSRIWLVPSLLHALLEAVPDLGRELPALTFWVASGEPLPAELYRRFCHAAPQATLYNLYGTSEIWDATWWSPDGNGENLLRVPIGAPIDNVRVYVLDELRQPLPVGVPGELYVAGLGLARGYVGQPELTAERFVELPFRAEVAYRTGDLVRFRPDGQLEFLGRLDQQVKIRGHRVEPAEIETVLTRHPGIHQAAVLADDGEQLVCWFVPANGAELTSTELRAFLAETVPAYMVPSSFVELDDLPLTTSGKLDRKALPAPHQGRLRSKSVYVAPRTPIEKLLAGIWSELLGLDRVGADDDFFADLGAHSLLATQLLSRLRDSLQWELPLQSVFEFPSVGLLATRVPQDPAEKHRLERTAEILLSLGEMSEEEAAAMLAAKRAQRERGA